jgi:hypothetical protein
MAALSSFIIQSAVLETDCDILAFCPVIKPLFGKMVLTDYVR